MICHRCHADAVAGTVSGMPLCWTCIRQVKAKMGKSFVGGPVPEDADASFLCYVAPVPSYIGKKVGSAAASGMNETSQGSAALEKGASAVKDITSTVKVLAIAGACFGGAFLIYTMWRAHQMQEKAVQFATTHPELARAALL